MSTVTKCDRCGEMYDPFGDSLQDNFESLAPWRFNIVKDLYPYPDKKTIDLCYKCKTKLVDWLHLTDEHGPASGRR